MWNRQEKVLRGMREVRVIPNQWAGKAYAGTSSALSSCVFLLPIGDTVCENNDFF